MSDTNTLERIDPVTVEMVPGSVDVLLSKALEMNVPIETLERLIALRKDLKAERARDQFFEAMAMFQGMKPRIPKKWAVMNKDGQTVRYRYAKIDDITELIDLPLSECGLSYSFESEFTTENNKPIEITTCIVKHLAGHSERSSCRIPVEFSTAMNAAQSYATAGTYGRRYALCNALGITPEEDDDAETTHTSNEDSGQQKSTIRPPQKTSGAGPDHDEVLSNVLIEGYNVAKDGKPAGIKVSGEWFNYFDTKLDEPAKAFKTGRVPADIYLKINGKFKNVVRIEAHKEEPSGSAPASENGQQKLA